MALFWDLVRAGFLLKEQAECVIIDFIDTPDIDALEQTKLYKHLGYIKRPSNPRSIFSLIPLDKTERRQKGISIARYNDEGHYYYEKTHIFQPHIITSLFRNVTNAPTSSVEKCKMLYCILEAWRHRIVINAGSSVLCP